MYTRLLEPDQISQSMVAKRGLTNVNSYPYVKTSFKTQHGSNFGCNWTSFHNTHKKRKLKMPKQRV